ncbi:YT521-B-like domain-containing protein [Trichoderma velutinum]
MQAADSDGETSSGETTRSVSQENQSQQQHQHDGNITLDVDSYINLWLQYTGFFDIKHRQKVFTALRKLKALDEQRSKILEEIRTSTSTESSGSSTASTVPQSPSALKGLSFPFSMAQKTNFVNYNTLLGSRSTAFTTSNEHYDSEVFSANKGADSDTWSTTFRGRNRQTSSQYDAQNGQPSNKASASLDNPGSEIQEAKSPSSSDGPFETESRRFSKSQSVRTYTPSQILSLAPKQVWAESRYFLVKSFNAKNVEMSQRDGLWTTTARNSATFANAFKYYKNVFLIFSVNKSKAFQGYARMTSPPTTTIPPAKWMDNISWKPGPPFRIQWLSTRRTEFWRLNDLKNPLNDGEPVFVGRDGQEFPESCGRKMVRVLDRRLLRDRERSSDDSWMTRKGYDDAHKDGMATWQHDNGDKDEMATWQNDESSEAGEDVSASPEPEQADDMPLIKY